MDHAGATRGVYPARCFHPCRGVRGAGAVQSACERVHGAAVLHTTGHAAETVGGASDALHMVKKCLACSVLHTTPPRHGATRAGTPIMKQARLGGGYWRCSAQRRSMVRAVPQSKLAASWVQARMAIRDVSCGLRNKVMRRGQRVQGRNRAVVGGGAQGWVGGVCDGRLTHGADGSGAGAKD